MTCHLINTAVTKQNCIEALIIIIVPWSQKNPRALNNRKKLNDSVTQVKNKRSVRDETSC